MDHPDAKNVPMQRGARFVLRRSAPMQRGTHFSVLHVPSRAPCCAQAGHPKRYKTNAFFAYFEDEGHTGSGHHMDPEEQTNQNQSEK